ncbi:MAG: helix-turn-helix domain-containing protein [Oscillospiraceae bacterium]|nr:helix-turn-helix domain-containing protein [Oscillospiraceae bacterium]
MPKKLNDTKVLEIVTKHANGTSISALARQYKISRNTVKSYLNSKSDFEQKLTDIKNETITQWLESHKGDLTSILDQITKLLPKKLSKASVKELFGGLKILTDLGVNINKDGDGSDDAISVNITFADTSGGKNE